MAMSKGSKIGIAVLVGAALLLAGGAANAAEDDDDEPLPPPPPPDIDPIPAFDPTEDDDDDEPLPPPPPTCNFSGCGPQFDNTHNTPTFYAIRLQQLGYPINPAAPGWSLVSAASRQIVREFQRDWNHVKPTVPGWSALPVLAADGLVGNRTIDAINRAHLLQTARIQAWSVIVDLVPGNP